MDYQRSKRNETVCRCLLISICKHIDRSWHGLVSTSSAEAHLLIPMDRCYWCSLRLSNDSRKNSSDQIVPFPRNLNHCIQFVSFIKQSASSNGNERATARGRPSSIHQRFRDRPKTWKWYLYSSTWYGKHTETLCVFLKYFWTMKVDNDLESMFNFNFQVPSIMSSCYIARSRQWFSFIKVEFVSLHRPSRWPWRRPLCSVHIIHRHLSTLHHLLNYHSKHSIYNTYINY